MKFQKLFQQIILKISLLLDTQFEEALKNSVFEYNTKYIAHIYRHDENYNSGKLRCKNTKSKILFHGTNSCSISMILAGQFRESKTAIFGPGVYFSDLLDYTWFYADDSGKAGSRKNFYTIPKINATTAKIAVTVEPTTPDAVVPRPRSRE